MGSFLFQETLHKHDTVEVEKVAVERGEDSVSLPIPGNMSRSGSRKYSVCEGIESPALFSPFGSLHEDELQNSGRRRSQNFDRFQSRSSSLRSQHDNDEEYIGASDGCKDLPGTDTPKRIQGEAVNLLLTVGTPRHYCAFTAFSVFDMHLMQ